MIISTAKDSIIYKARSLINNVRANIWHVCYQDNDIAHNESFLHQSKMFQFSSRVPYYLTFLPNINKPNEEMSPSKIELN